MIRRWVFAGVTLLALSIPLTATSVPARAQERGLLIEGHVTNGSPDTPVPVGLVVTLHQEGSPQHDHLETTTDAEGHFQFENIVPESFVVYGVSVRYQEALYGTDINLLDGKPPLLLLEIFEATDDLRIIHANSASILFANADKETQTVSVLEIVQLANDSDYTYVAGTDNPMSLLRFGLPPGSESLQVDTRLLGADVVQVDRGFAVLAAIPPGQHDIMYTYEFPYTGTVETFTKSLPFGAEGLRVLSPDEVVTLSSEDLGSASSITIGDRPYQLIEQANLARGSRFNVTLSDLPQSSFVERLAYSAKSTRPVVVAPVILATLMAVLTLFAIRRHRRLQAMPASDGDPSAVRQQERWTLLRLVSELERSYEDGSLPAEDYHRRRRVLESRLLSMQED